MEKQLETCQQNLVVLQRQIEICSQYQAHELRGPLARILGITKLIKLDSQALNMNETMDLIHENAQELDRALKHITVLLEECLDMTNSKDQYSNMFELE